MTTYRLPAELGGIEVREAGKRGDGRLILVPVAAELVELDWEFCLDQGALTEVKPPLPPEPPQGSFVAVVSQQWGDAYMGYQQVWYGHMGGWMVFGDRSNTIFGWAAVCANGEPRLLVPDPVGSAPELPWEYRDEDRIRFGVDLHSAEPLVAFDSTCPRYYMPLDQAEQMALAILRAAREARAAS